jgi:hypothetical protein
MIGQFDFKLQTHTFYGFGYSRKLGAFLQDRNFNNVVLMVHEGVYENSEYFKEIQSILESHTSTMRMEVLRGSEEPDYDYLDECTSSNECGQRIDLS